MRIDVVNTLAHLTAPNWNELVSTSGGNVFLSHEYLSALHETGCATGRTGWQPNFIVATENERLLGALPLYLKSHSYGEYVFDWAWADAYKRAGGLYYPKLLCAIPFTPCTGPRVLAANDEVRAALMRAAVAKANEFGVSSLHVLFPTAEETAGWKAHGLLPRQGVQFHWKNAGYANFDAMLATMSHDKRKRIKQDRRYVRDAGIAWRVTTGNSLQPGDVEFFFRCYESTYAAHFSTPYLSLDFFYRMMKVCADALVLFIGERDGQPICASFCVKSENTLYGRYWGTIETVRSLHFEACYYKPIEWCIENGIQVFEGGAQGMHKLARGLLPMPTYSMHWIRDPKFADAIADYLHNEKIGVLHTIEELSEATPFKEIGA